MKKNPIKNASILVTGGAGFVGSHLVEALLKYSPKKIYIIDNLIRGSCENMKSFLKNSKVTFIEGDIRSETKVNNLMKRSDYCFHLAALRLNACAADPAEAFDVMVRSTFHIVDSAKKNKIKKLIYSSSASIYGQALHFPTSEEENPYDNKTMYGAAKLFGEQLLRSFHHMYGLSFVALRYFNVYGPRMDVFGKYTEVMIRWLECIRDNKNPIIYGDGSNSMDFVYVGDVVKANILALMSSCDDEVFNVASGKETSLKTLLRLLLKVNNSSLVPIIKPEATVNPVARRLADTKKAKKLLGYKADISLNEGLKKLSDWYLHP